MNYKRLTEIDESIKDWESIYDKIEKGNTNSDLYPLYARVKITVGRVGSTPLEDEAINEFRLYKHHILNSITATITSLKEEKEKLLNKKWYEFWK